MHIWYYRSYYDCICHQSYHDDVIKWKHFPRYWPFVRRIHRSPVNSPHKGQSRGALMLSLICALNKQLSKQAWGWWLKSPAGPFWPHCNVTTNKKWLKYYHKWVLLKLNSSPIYYDELIVTTILPKSIMISLQQHPQRQDFIITRVSETLTSS